ncbi:sugar transporter [Pseudogemmobacter sonorensis]|uniref:sugar transporter n=1 Tax=Pseudogemmobacter sonorensis TaxID=2989681 RepID=UPI0036C8DFA8
MSAPPPAAVPAPEPPGPIEHGVAGPAKMHRRHRMLMLSFLACVVLPSLLVAFYLFVVAEDQYASELGFSVQTEEGGSASDLLGGLVRMGGGGSGSDPQILYKYITSRDMLIRVEERIDTARAFTRPGDFFYSLASDATIEDRERHWRRMVNAVLDSGSGLIEIRVRAFTPEDAQQIALLIEEESARLLNQLNDKAREDATRFARDELALASERLSSAQTALTAFRSRTQIVDPATDLAGRMGLLNSLLAQQAEAMIERDMLIANGAAEDDPRIRQAERRIEVIGGRIEAERARIRTADDGSDGGYAMLVAEYERLALETEFARQSYLAAKANLDAAIARASRTTRFLASYMPPTLAERAQYPERFVWTALVSGMIFLLWSIATLTYYAVRDRQ